MVAYDLGLAFGLLARLQDAHCGHTQACAHSFDSALISPGCCIIADDWFRGALP